MDSLSLSIADRDDLGIPFYRKGGGDRQSGEGLWDIVFVRGDLVCVLVCFDGYGCAGCVNGCVDMGGFVGG